MKKHLKPRSPALNIPRKHEPVATDTIFSDTPAVESGVIQAQVFVGRNTLVADDYQLKVQFNLSTPWRTTQGGGE